jgi:tRNA pseudouridine55 synthase
MKADTLHGLLVLDKPGGMTSRAALDAAQRWLPRGTRAGHTGTLDPLATGVLVLCVGAATRLTEYVQDMAKTYRAGLLLGHRSDTDDADGTITEAVRLEIPPTRAAIETELQSFVGEIDQVPPQFSAAHVGGRRAYDLARRGEEVALQPRRVRIDGIDVLSYAYPLLEIEVRCGKGTYIRSLARDLGERLGCGALVQTLRRTRLGPFDAAQAVTLDVDGATARAHLLPVAAAVGELPAVTIGADQARALRQGKPLALAAPAADGAAVAVFDAAGALVAVATYQERECLLRPAKVLTL